MRLRNLFISIFVLGAAGAGALYWRQGNLDLPWLSASKHAPASTTNAALPSPPISVVVADVATADLPVRLRSIGWVEPLSTVAVKSRVQSQLLRQYFKEGQMVKEGQLLFSLDDRELKAQVEKDQANLAKDQALHINAVNNLNRDKLLLARNAGTQQALDQGISDEKSAAASILADQAALDADNLHLSYAKIFAPITGRVGVVNVTPGNLVNASDSGTGLVTITQMQPVRVSFSLPERDLEQLQKALAAGAAPAVRISPSGSAGKEIEGRLNFIDSSVDLPSGTITAKALFANDDLGLWPGRYGAVDVEVAMHPGAVVAPSTAIQNGQNGFYAFVLKPDGKSVEQRTVKIGEVSAGMTEILAGLSGGDKVVVDGQLRLANGSPVRVGNPTGGSAENDKKSASLDKRG